MNVSSQRTLGFIAVVVGLATWSVGCGGGNANTPCPETAAAQSSSTTASSTDVPLSEPLTAPASLSVQSSDFANGATIPVVHSFNGFGCTGENRSPNVSWSGAPPDTKSYALVVHDPDAPTGVGFFHWLVYDIPANVTSLAANAATSLPEGAHAGHTDFGTTSYGGPCPPPGSSTHRYVFTVYALDVPTLGIEGAPTGALLRFMLGQHTLAYGRTQGTFER